MSLCGLAQNSDWFVLPNVHKTLATWPVACFGVKFGFGLQLALGRAEFVHSYPARFDELEKLLNNAKCI